MSINLTNLSNKKGLKDNLFEEIQNASTSGSASKEKLKEIAKSNLVGEANLLGASTFYDFLKPENEGKKAYICNGTSCLMAGKQAVVKDAILRHYDESEIGNACCLGRCHENAAFQIEGTNYSGADIVHIPEIITQKTTRHTVDYYHTEATCLQPVLMRTYMSLKDYYVLYDHIIESTPDDIIEIVKQSGLRGRGGAGYPMGNKMEACHSASGKQKYIVCNADEGDPGSYSDRYLLEHHPHSILFGMLVSGYACGADTGIIYIRAEYPDAIQVIQDAIASFEEIAQSFSNPTSFKFKIIKGAGSYVCGEETALLASIEGQRPEVRIRPPYPTTYGLYGKPTLVNNVETLANLHFILEHGADIYQSIGTADSVGTKLVCLDGQFNRPGVYEVAFGTPLKKIIDDYGQGFKVPVKAIQIGGPLGSVVPVEKWDNLTYDFESLEAAGFTLGHGSIVAIPNDYPMIEFIEHLFSFAAHESCGKCFPCRLGTQRGMEMIQNALSKKEPVNPELFGDLLTTLELGSLCGLGGELPLPIKNILYYFSDEMEPFFGHQLTPTI